MNKKKNENTSLTILKLLLPEKEEGTYSFWKPLHFQVVVIWLDALLDYLAQITRGSKITVNIKALQKANEEQNKASSHS